MNVKPAPDFDHLIAQWSEARGDLIVAHANSPNGLALQIKELRRTIPVPLIILLERPREEDTATLLNLGADLVLPTPTGPKVLAAYCQSLLRRSGRRPSFALPVLDLGGIALDPSTREVKVGDQPPTRLTQMEFRLMYLLMVNRGEVLPTEVIVDHVWGYSEPSSRELVRGLISRVRTKVERELHEKKYIHTIPGVGYLFDTEPR